MAAVGIVIGVGKNGHESADARGVAEALQALGVAVPAESVLVDAAATKTQIESKLRTVLKTLSGDDRLSIYYSGPGFTSIRKQSYLTSHDFIQLDAEETSIPVSWIFDKLSASKCGSVALFLDCGADALAGFTPGLNDREIATLTTHSERCVCFLACRAGESSHFASALERGVWAAALIQALHGDAPAAVDGSSRVITAAALQAYLADEVPRLLRKHVLGSPAQTPWMCGADSDAFTVVDVSTLVDQRAQASRPADKQLTRASLWYTQIRAVSKLKGFKKGQQRIRDHSDWSQRLVATLGREDLDAEINDTFDKLKSEFKFKRKDLDTPLIEGGHGTIITPHFDFEIDLALDPEDLTQVLWRYEITSIRKPEAILSDEFEAIFGSRFDTMEFGFQGALNVSDLIDTIENLDTPELSLSYDKEATWCRIVLPQSDFEFTVTKGSFKLRTLSAVSPKALISAFWEAQKVLVGQHGLKALPFDSMG